MRSENPDAVLQSFWQIQLARAQSEIRARRGSPSPCWCCLFTSDVLMMYRSAHVPFKNIPQCALSLLSLLMMTCLFCVPTDHGRTGGERSGPRLGHPPSILRSCQDGHRGLHVSVYQNIPEQNLPRVPGQEETQEKHQELARAQ